MAALIGAGGKLIIARVVDRLGKGIMCDDARGIGPGLKVAAYQPSKSVDMDAAFCLPWLLSLLL